MYRIFFLIICPFLFLGASLMLFLLLRASSLLISFIYPLDTNLNLIVQPHSIREAFPEPRVRMVPL